VYTTLIKVEANQDTVQFFPDPRWDNDVDNGQDGKGPKALASKLDVKAWYQAINNPDSQEPYPLTYYFARDISKDPPYKAGPYYLFGTDADKDDDNPGTTVDDSTYVKGLEKYKTNTIGKGKETITNITIKHEMDSSVIAQYYSWYFYGSEGLDNYSDGVLPDSQTLYDPSAPNTEPEYFGPKAAQSKKTKVSGNWINGNK